MRTEEQLNSVLAHFSELSELQKDQVSKLYSLYQDWNSQINVISRKDFIHFYERHVLHSMSISFFNLLGDSTVLDVGTGGGFPGIPLAILFPEARFTLMDSIGKKLKVVSDIADKLDLGNVKTIHSRMEDHKVKYDFITGRAVTDLPTLFNWTKHLVNWHKGKGQAGMLYLKGGDFLQELKKIPRKVEIHELNEVLEGEFFETKKLVSIYQ